jgi:hypothetical protein
MTEKTRVGNILLTGLKLRGGSCGKGHKEGRIVCAGHADWATLVGYWNYSQ